MYNSKKDVDNHVRAAFQKLRTEKERALRSLTIAKLYFKIKEYPTALQYLCSYISVKEDNDQAHKMLGQCYQYLKQSSKALQSYQRSLQLNPKQPDLLAEVCKMLVDDKEMSASKAKYWCELAESERVEDESVYALRLKLMNQSNVQSGEIEAILLKGINSRPNDVNTHIRLIRHFLDQQRILDAFKYVYDFEMQQNDAFINNNEWYNIIWTVLSKYEQHADAKQDWNYALLVALCLERLVFLSFMTTDTDNSVGMRTTVSITETANLLFRFDQYLFKIEQLRKNFKVEKELVKLFLEHYRGQLVLHTVALLFKRELLQKKNKWRGTLQLALPLLLLAFHTEPKENKAPWMKHCDEKSVKLINLWYREGAFRCAQAGRILLTSITDDNKENSKLQINSVFGTQTGVLWSNADELLAQVRKSCVDSQWRRNVFAQLFCNSDQRLKEQTSLLVKSESLSEPVYELPSVATLEEYEEVAQYLRPQSLSHIVYLHLSCDNLANVNAKYFNGLKFSVPNLSFCGAESLNQLDIDTYFYATTIQAQRLLDITRETNDVYSGDNSQNGINRPRILPFVNMHENLCKDEQANWWLLAYKVYKNLVKGDNTAQMRADLQAGIEAVRGQNGPKMDILIAFKLGQLLVERAKLEQKPIERGFVEARAEQIYQHGLKMLKLHSRGVLEPFRRTFEYAKSNSSAIEREINEFAEQAVIYISERMLRDAKYEELIEEMNGVPLPFASYKQSEACRKLSEAKATSKANKQRYYARAIDYLQQTNSLLKSAKFDANHPLNAIIHSELKRLQKSSKKFNGDDSNEFSLLTEGDNFGELSGTGHNNSSIYEDPEEGEFYSPANRSRRDVLERILTQATTTPAAAAAAAATAAHNSEMDALVKRIACTLDLVKDEITTLKPEVMTLRQEMISLKDKVAQLEDTINKKQNPSEPPSRDDASNVLDDLYIIDDALQNQFLMQNHNQQTNSMFPNAVGAAGMTPNQFGNSCTQPRIQTPNALQMQQAAAARVAAYNNPMFNPNYPLNYYTSPYLLAQQSAAAAANPLLAQRGQLGGLPYVEPSNAAGAFNFPVPPITPVFPPPPTNPTDNRANGYNLLNQPQGNLPTLTLPPNSTLNLGQFGTTPINTTSTAAATTSTPIATTTSATSNASFNKTLNNQPVEKGPPANVVITSSDPLPNLNSIMPQEQQQQPILSVTIPPQHIKPSLIPTTTTEQTAAIVGASGANTTFGGTDFNSSAGHFSFGLANKDSTANATTNFINSFSFKPAVQQALAAAKPEANNTLTLADSTPLNESSSSELNRTLDPENAEYDPRPDFQPIIPLPDEIEVRTGEEDETVMFSEHAKLYRFMDKEWKERGVGTLKILKSADGQSRILMRRDQTHKICANHKITKDLQLNPKLEKNGYTWAAPDFADGEMRSEIFFLRFKLQETAKKFAAVFEKAQEECKAIADEDVNEPTSTITSTTTAKTQEPFGLSKSSVTSFAASTPTSKSETPKTAAVNLQPAGGVKPFGLFGTSTAATSTVASSTSTSVAKPLFAGLNWASSIAGGTATTAVSSTTTKPFANFSFGVTPTATSSTSVSSTTTAASGITSFSNLFSKSTEPVASPFSVANLNLPNFGGTPATTTLAPSAAAATGNAPANTSNVSDAEDDDYVPTAEFAPVIELPELVDLSTGEENYLPLFEHRAKLLRFDKETREWKERGIGNIRILKHKDDADNVRLVMRREQIHKLCCNQRLYKDIEFKYAKGSQSALQWVGQDFSEGELTTELLTIRFKAAETCGKFLDTIQKAQAAMSDKAKQIQGDKESENKTNATKDGKTTEAPTTKGFGDAFKPKAGSWSCSGCLVSNAADKLYCAACESPKDDTVPKKNSSATSFLPAANTSFTFGFGNTNQSGANQPNGKADPKPAAVNVTKSNATESSNSFGDKFKPKPGAWTCQDCYTSNGADKIYCAACEAPKDSSIPKKQTSNDTNTSNNANILALSNPNQKFSFGFPAAAAATATSTTPPSFGVAASTISTVPTTKPAFGFPSTSTSLTTLAKPTFNFSLQSSAVTSPAMPVDKTTSAPNPTGFTFSSTFSFNKDNTDVSTKKADSDSTPKSAGHDDADADDSGLLHEEENNTYFTPAIPLPDKIDVKTGEEDEEVLYQHRAKLYRFTNGEWKERGIGDVKILRHRVNKKLRVVMRRDQVHKICLNHVLNADVEYKRKDDKAWLFVVNDFSEGEVSLEKLSLRFKTKDIAEGFMNAVKSALATDCSSTDNTVNGHTDESQKNEIEKIQQKPTETTTTKKTENVRTPEKVDAKWSLEQPELKLPQSSKLKEALNVAATTAATGTATVTSPAHRTFALKQSVLPTVAAAPTDAEKEKEANKTSAPAAVNFSFAAALKESETTKPTLATGGFLFGSNSSTTNTNSSSPFSGSIFGGGGTTFGQTESIFSSKPKDSANDETKNIFGKAAIQSPFGNTGGGSLFSNIQSAANDQQQKSNDGSLFFGSKTTTTSSNTNNNTATLNNKPIFGGTPIFGDKSAINKNGGGSGGSLFGNLNLKPATAASDAATKNETTTENKPTFSFADLSSGSGAVDFASIAAAANNNNVLRSNQTPGQGGFIGLTNENAFSSFQNRNNVNANNDNDNAENDADGSAVNDENYDPHYEPIIPLPQEVVVSTGEEDEERLFSERATLFRYDATNKEWKERGVGDFKILKHRSQNRFRLVLRREQVHKLVLNFAITSDFKFGPMNNNPKSFVFAGMNYAESSEGECERLAVRFKKIEIANQFSAELNRCLEEIQQNQAA